MQFVLLSTLATALLAVFAVAEPFGIHVGANADADAEVAANVGVGAGAGVHFG
ncbi:hypothetical protein BDV35DRAFT_344929 [Aspergillus flavus]|uniref:Uncharacterized protein n=1 Tax=Aspergillus flavus TaxID=5059 RepID=A0A5N6HAK4_ASPFL|nr:hypothetical protein BDV35DRAFT_344929 [Aspergillus flavus]UDD58830.1 hypothetical protein AFCA_006252 [Aspergillus flavus]